MAKTKSSMAETVEAALKAEPLFDFLKSHDAQLLATYKPPRGMAFPELRTYLIRPYVIVVSLSVHGWDLYIPASTKNDTAATLEAAAKFLDGGAQ